MGPKHGTLSKNKSRYLSWYLEIFEELIVDLGNFTVAEGVHAHHKHVEDKNLIIVKRQKKINKVVI